jgi:hypothetical protein
VPMRAKRPLRPAATATSPNPRFQTPDFMDASLPHGPDSRAHMREAGLVLLLALSVGVEESCTPTSLRENWTCDWDSSVERPLSGGDGPTDDAGKLSPSECAATCGPPVGTCTRTTLDGGVPGAICPVCTF